MALFKKKFKDELTGEVYNESKALNTIKSRKFVFITALVVLIVLLFVGKSVLSTDKIDYFDTLEQVFSNELGYFKYTLDVRSGDKGTLITDATVAQVTVEDLNQTENAETATTEETDTENSIADQSGEVTQKNEFQDWNKYADVKSGHWKHPNYKITIEGNTTSLEPLKTNFKIYLATNTYNDVFTEVYCIDGNYYLDTESMYNWLKNSGDSYLVEVGEKLPNGSKWLVIPENEFGFSSRYAEDGELEFSEATSLTQMYRRFLVGLNTVKSSLQGVVGSEGQKVSDDIVTLNLSGNSAANIVKGFKSITSRSGDFYTSLVETGKSKGLYDDNQYKQAIREKDNFIEAMYDLSTYLQISDISAMNTKLGGSARIYTNGYGNQQIEASLAVNLSGENDYIIQFTGIKAGDNNPISLPSGSQTKEINPVYRETLDSVFDYLNFTPIKSEVKLEINPDTISDEIINRFVNLVNDVGTAGYWVTPENVKGFIETYANFDKDAQGVTDEEYMNAKLVEDLAISLNNIVGGVIVEKEVEVVEEVEQYPAVVFSDSGVDFKITYNQDSSSEKIITAKLEVINKSESDYTFNITDFSMRSLLNSIHPANNETLIRTADNTFDMTLLSTEVTLVPSQWAEYILYFVPSDDTGHMDLYFGESNCGSIIEY